MLSFFRNIARRLFRPGEGTVVHFGGVSINGEVIRNALILDFGDDVRALERAVNRGQAEFELDSTLAVVLV